MDQTSNQPGWLQQIQSLVLSCLVLLLPNSVKQHQTARLRLGRVQVAGALIGPHALGIIQDVEGVRHLAELGVVFLLFNIGLELSLERLRSMQKYVFGMGTSQVGAWVQGM